MAVRRQPPGGGRSDQLDDVAGAIARMTLDVAKDHPDERHTAPQFKRILLATDGSPASSPAVAWAVGLARRRKARVIAVSVAPEPHIPRVLLGNRPALDPDLTLVAKGAQLALAKAGGALKRAGVSHSLELQHGPAAAAIVALAENESCDLVVLGAHGHGLGERLNLGRIGASVKHHAPCSVLVARRPPPPRRILMATDGSPRSRIAVQVGRDLARDFGAKQTMAHVVDASSYGLDRIAASCRTGSSPCRSAWRTRR